MGEARTKRLLRQDPCSCGDGLPCVFALVLGPTIDRMKAAGYSIFPYQPPPKLQQSIVRARRNSTGFRLAWVRICSARACDSGMVLDRAYE